MDYEKEVAILPRPTIPRQTGSGRLLQVWLNQDMRNGHEGLAEVAKQGGLDVSKLKPGQYLVFINAKMDRIKMYGANNVVAYQVLEGGRKVDLRVVREIPKVFQSTGKLDYDLALERVVTDYFAAKYPRKAKESGLELARKIKG